MVTLRECIDRFEAAEASRPTGTPVRVIRSAHLKTEYWRQDATSLTGSGATFEALRLDQLALTGEHLGTDRVGLIVDEGTEPWQAVPPEPLTEAELMAADVIVWVGMLGCGCRPFAIVDTQDGGHGAIDDVFGYLLGHAAEVEAYSLEAVLAGRVVGPCTHGAIGGDS